MEQGTKIPHTVFYNKTERKRNDAYPPPKYFHLTRDLAATMPGESSNPKYASFKVIVASDLLAA